jgi:hypothetical protein
VGYKIYWDTEHENAGLAICVPFSAIVVVLAIAALILTILCFDTARIDERIDMYETENAKIEQQLADVVRMYQEYEQETFDKVTEKNVMSYISLYPELKSDSMIEKQMAVYYNNYEKLAELKETQIMAPIYRWWVYFGK